MLKPKSLKVKIRMDLYVTLHYVWILGEEKKEITHRSDLSDLCGEKYSAASSPN
jgi:hypothetical protein